MAKTKASDPKIAALRQHGALNRHPERVESSLFADGGFFDARDLVQVRYEMVRCVQAEGVSVSDSAASFGLSRPAFYHAQMMLDRGGLANLVPKKRGPRHAHKLGDDVMAFVQDVLRMDPLLRSAELARRIQEQFGVEVHPRSVERALDRAGKKTT